MNKHILVVEDEAILYRRMKKFLQSENYSVAAYCKSVDEAIAQINKKRPDLILLDIQLEGDLSGIDLGKILNERYKIPFIYLTQFDDERHFAKGLETNAEHYVVKTKPTFDKVQLSRVIRTVLHKYEEANVFFKDGVLGLKDYLSKLQESGLNEVTRAPVAFEEIGFFTTRPLVSDEGKVLGLKDNYAWLLTKNKERYFLKMSLTNIYKHLPEYFVRVSDNHIVNLKKGIFDGKIEGRRISVLDNEITVSDTYKEEFNNRLKNIYIL